MPNDVNEIVDLSSQYKNIARPRHLADTAFRIMLCSLPFTLLMFFFMDQVENTEYENIVIILLSLCMIPIVTFYILSFRTARPDFRQICPGCNKNIADEIKFCSNCGNSVVKSRRGAYYCQPCNGCVGIVGKRRWSLPIRYCMCCRALLDKNGYRSC